MCSSSSAWERGGERRERGEREGKGREEEGEGGEGSGGERDPVAGPFSYPGNGGRSVRKLA